MLTITRLPIAAVVTAISMLTACDHTPKEWKSQNMTSLTPRLQAVFHKTKTVCFGRFMVDVPFLTTVAWGEADVSLRITVIPDGVDDVKVRAQKFIDELKAEKAINHGGAPLLVSVDNVDQPEGKIVTGYEGFQSIDDLKINGYFRLNNDGFIINARPLMDEKDETIADINSIARRLRRRAEDEIPNEPGNCIEHAFLPDNAAQAGEPPAELIRVGFRLNEFPDVHLSIFISPSNPNYSESDSLEWQLDRFEKEVKAQGSTHQRQKTKYLRRGRGRQIYDWQNGFEALSRTPEQTDVHSIHDFAMDFRGVPSDPLKPSADIRMQTGVADNAAGATKASLSDEEAIAVWDKITSTIRVRPTTAAPVVTTQAGSGPQLLLGELAATGRTCPQTGWWEPDGSNGVKSQRQHIRAGERMPHVISLGEPSLWQKLKGGRPSYRTATVWTLVSYEEASVYADTPTQATAIAKASADIELAAKDANGDTSESSPNKESPPHKKG